MGWMTGAEYGCSHCVLSMFLEQEEDSFTYMLLPLVELFSDERLAGFAEDPLLHQCVTFRVVLDLQAWWNTIDILHEIVVQEGSPTFDGMRHFRAVPNARKQQVR